MNNSSQQGPSTPVPTGNSLPQVQATAVPAGNSPAQAPATAVPTTISAGNLDLLLSPHKTDVQRFAVQKIVDERDEWHKRAAEADRKLEVLSDEKVKTADKYGRLEQKLFDLESTFYFSEAITCGGGIVFTIGAKMPFDLFPWPFLTMFAGLVIIAGSFFLKKIIILRSKKGAGDGNK
jgi:hypothetical protein